MKIDWQNPNVIKTPKAEKVNPICCCAVHILLVAVQIKHANILCHFNKTLDKFFHNTAKW